MGFWQGKWGSWHILTYFDQENWEFDYIRLFWTRETDQNGHDTQQPSLIHFIFFPGNMCRCRCKAWPCPKSLTWPMQTSVEWTSRNRRSRRNAAGHWRGVDFLDATRCTDLAQFSWKSSSFVMDTTILHGVSWRTVYSPSPCSVFAHKCVYVV